MSVFECVYVCVCEHTNTPLESCGWVRCCLSSASSLLVGVYLSKFVCVCVYWYVLVCFGFMELIGSFG